MIKRRNHPTVDNPQLALSLLDKFSDLWVQPSLDEVCHSSLYCLVVSTAPLKSNETATESGIRQPRHPPLSPALRVPHPPLPHLSLRSSQLDSKKPTRESTAETREEFRQTESRDCSGSFPRWTGTASTCVDLERRDECLELGYRCDGGKRKYSRRSEEIDGAAWNCCCNYA